METVKVEWHLSVGLVGCEKSGTEESEKEKRKSTKEGKWSRLGNEFTGLAW